MINVLRRPSSSLIRISDEARGWFAEHRRLLPRDAKLEAFYDQSDLVRASVQSVQDSLLAGALLAFLVVALFLGNLRLGLGGAVVLPVSIAVTLLGLGLSHQTINMMTLGGIAAAVGLVLDDAIVVVEHMAHRVAEDGAAFDRFAAMAEIFPAMLGSSLCTIAIFIPFMFLGGVTGAFFKVLALAMTLMLGSSLLVCTTVLPLLSHGRARRARAAGAGRGARGRGPAHLAGAPRGGAPDRRDRPARALARNRVPARDGRGLPHPRLQLAPRHLPERDRAHVRGSRAPDRGDARDRRDIDADRRPARLLHHRAQPGRLRAEAGAAPAARRRGRGRRPAAAHRGVAARAPDRVRAVDRGRGGGSHHEPATDRGARVRGGPQGHRGVCP